MERYTGIIHFHSCCSYDSMTKTRSIAHLAAAQSWNFLVLTDHDTLDGSKRLQDYVTQKNLNIEVPLAAEYLTDVGDVIAAFVQKEIKSRKIDEFVAEVKEQGGVTLLPHPYVSHHDVEEWAQKMDLIEVFNSRQSTKKDELSAKLAARLNKPVYYSPDAHLPGDMALAPVRMDKVGTLKESLLQQKIEPLTLQKSTQTSYRLSQGIKMFKTGDFSPVFRKLKDLF